MNKPTNKRLPNQKWFLLFAGFLIYTSCYEPVEACIDPAATNFNASADNNCCCEYPNINLKTTWVYDTITHNAGIVYENEIGQLFSIKKLDILISDISPSFESEHYPLEDKITFQTFDDDTINTENNISYLSSATNSTFSGEFYSYGSIDQLEFRGGIESQELNLHSISSDHSLSNAKTLIQANSMDSIYALYCIIHKDTIDSLPSDTITLPFYSDLGIAEISCIIENDLGNDRIIPILADLKKCFHSMDMEWTDRQMAVWLEDNIIKIFSCNSP